MKNIFDILACPTCKIAVQRTGDRLHCTGCGCDYPIVNGVPIMMPGGQYTEVKHEMILNVQKEYAPWWFRMVLQSLTDNQIVLDAGAGNTDIDDPCVIRMDVALTPYVDIVGDFHALPFLPGSLDYIFALAVFEHLRQPFLAAEEAFRVLKPGGYIYAEANFVYAYHGYPHHYFNISIQGFEQIFSQFRVLCRGVAPYHMPGFALEFVLSTYLNIFRPETDRELEFVNLLQRALEHPLYYYDNKLQPGEAYRVAAGTCVVAIKQPGGNDHLIPAPVWDLYQRSPELQKRFPDPVALFEPDNLMYWARTEAAKTHPDIQAVFTAAPTFSKRGESAAAFDRSFIKNLPVIPPPGQQWFTDPRLKPADQQPAPPPENFSYLVRKTWEHARANEWKLLFFKLNDFLRKKLVRSAIKMLNFK